MHITNRSIIFMFWMQNIRWHSPGKTVTHVLITPILNDWDYEGSIMKSYQFNILITHTMLFLKVLDINELGTTKKFKSCKMRLYTMQYASFLYGSFESSDNIYFWALLINMGVLARVNTSFKFSDPCHKYFWQENYEYCARKTSIIPHCQKSLYIKLSDDRLFKEVFRLACLVYLNVFH